jgi:RNA polymerase sigma factor (sigma-70 family)
MATADFNAVLDHLRGMAAGHALRDVTDTQLLDQFTAGRDQIAFAVLVHRHGPMVLEICRHLLPNVQDAEDAFQVTFLVLARQAASIRKREAVASWLHGVAHRTALTARRAAARRRARERRAEGMARRNAPGGLEWREVQAALEEEVGRLPATYKAPFVLCWLEGRGRAEAARELGLKEGTVSSRLDRARKLLQKRLARRGIALAVLLGATAVAQESVPVALAAATVRAAAQDAVDRAAAAGLISARAAALFDGVVRGLFLAKCRKALGVLLLLVGLAGAAAAGLRARERPAAQPPAPAAEGEAPEAGDGPPGRRETRPDPDGDALPAHAVARFGSMRLRHGGAVRGLAFTQDGKVLVSAGRDGWVRLWDRATGRELRRMGDRDPFQTFALSADGRVLAVGTQGPGRPVVGLWDLAAGKELRRLTLAGTGPPLAVAFRPDGRVLAAAGRAGSITLWDVDTGAEIRTWAGHEGGVACLAFAPDGQSLVSGGQDQSLRLWDPATGRLLRRLEPPRDQAPAVMLAPDAPVSRPSEPLDGPIVTKAVRVLGGLLAGDTVPVAPVAPAAPVRSPVLQAAAFSPDGRALASGGQDGVIHLWNPATGEEVRHLAGHPGGTLALAFAPDGRRLVSGGQDWVVRVWDVATGEELRQLPGSLHVVPAVAFSPDGQVIASGSDDFRVRLWDADTGRDLYPTAEHQGWIHALEFSPDGKTVAAGGLDGLIRLWDVAGRKEVARIDRGGAAVEGLAFSPDGRTLAALGAVNVVRLVDAADGRERTRCQGHQAIVLAVAWSTDGRVLASGGSDGTVRLWDPDSGKDLRVLVQLQAAVGALAFAPDGKTLAGAANDRTVRVWEVATGRELARMTGTATPRGCVGFAADGRTLVVRDDDGTAHLFEPATGQERGRFALKESVHALAFSPDGRRLAWGEGPAEVCVWDVAAERMVCRLRGHQGWVGALAFSPDGRTLASGSGDSTVLLWDLADVLGKQPPGGPKLAPAELEAEWSALTGDDAARAYKALWRLAAVPDQALPLVRSRWQPGTDADRDDPGAKRDGRLVELLEQIATPAARQVLEAVARRESGGRAAEEARAALERLSRHPPASPEAPSR